MEKCSEHSGVCANAVHNEKEIVTEKNDREKAIAEVWAGINAIKNGALSTQRWVIGGMGTTILAMALLVVQLITTK